MPSDYVDSGVEPMKDGVQVRNIFISRAGFRHMIQSKSDRAVKANLRGWDTHKPAFAEIDIISVEIHDSPAPEFEALARVKVAMGHRVFSKFANQHRDCAIAEVSHLAIIPDEGGWTIECPCGEELRLSSESLPSDMDSA